MKKIGIINFHCAHNYGAMLQAYALQKEVNKNGYEGIIVDFQPDIIMRCYKLWDIRKLRHPREVLRTIINYKSLKLKYNVFEKFKKENMKLTKTTKQIKKSDFNSNEFYAFICGSDQIWNMDLNGGLTEYLLSFIEDPKIKKISYAASIGSNKIKDKYIEVMKKELEKFESISMREDDAISIMKSTFNIDATHVLDPVFLLNVGEWDEVASKKIEVDGKYVLLYGLEENDLFEKTFKFIKENTKFKIINISPAKKVSKYIDETLYNVGPSEFIGLLKNSEVVFTNSFHGTCFSIIYGKKFFVIGHSELNSRIESILRLTGLESHIIDKNIVTIEEFNKTINFDYDRVKRTLDNEILKSKKYLIEALK